MLIISAIITVCQSAWQAATDTCPDYHQFHFFFQINAISLFKHNIDICFLKTYFKLWKLWNISYSTKLAIMICITCKINIIIIIKNMAMCLYSSIHVIGFEFRKKKSLFFDGLKEPNLDVVCTKKCIKLYFI